MNPDEKQLEIYQLNSILNIINEQLQETETEIADIQDQNIEVSNDMWSNAPHAVYDFDDVIELQDYNLENLERSEQLKRSKIKYRNLQNMMRSPYFGRLDFVDSNQMNIAQIYIGIHSLTSKAVFKCLIYDWRAPISSMFYDFGIGEASYESPSGEIKGNIKLKRQYKISNGAIEYMFDSDIKIDDDILQKELAGNSESKLKVIISSIQKEQNYAIRYNLNNNLIVFGPAGSGKTSIGLHRLAYQLYHLRGQLTSDNIVIFSQNNIYSSYISSTIPELGEEDIARISFRLLNHKYLSTFANQMDSYELSEYFMSAQESDVRLKGIQIKYSQGFMDYVQQFLADRITTFHDIVIFGIKICSGVLLSRRFMSDRKNYDAVTKRKRLYEYVENKIEDLFLRHADELKKQLLQRMVDAKIVDMELARLLKSTKDEIRLKINLESKLDAVTLYQEIVLGYIQCHKLDQGIYDRTFDQLAAGNLPFEDSLVLLWIKLLTGEVRVQKSIQHVLVDEAQDFNLLQHMIIKKLYGASRFTVLADVEQALFPTINVQEQADLLSIYNSNVVELTKSYRSTRQINELASKLLNGPKTNFYDRNGSKPTVISTTDIILSIEQVVNSVECKNHKSIGIITKTSEKALSLYEQLKDSIQVSVVNKGTSEFMSGVLIIPVTLAKGLEFDAVIVPYCSAEEFNEPYDKRILYLMCTRALHHLVFIHDNELTSHIAPYSDCYEEMV